MANLCRGRWDGSRYLTRQCDRAPRLYLEHLFFFSLFPPVDFIADPRPSTRPSPLPVKDNEGNTARGQIMMRRGYTRTDTRAPYDLLPRMASSKYGI